MIDVKVKIHDEFAFEFKISFIPTNKIEREQNNEFSINTWIFIPNSLDINSQTYSKELFFRDTKSNVRLITPIYSLRDIYKSSDNPLDRLKESIQKLLSEPSNTTLSDNYVYQVKLFSSIFKSASRDRTYHIIENQDDEKIIELINEYILDVTNILTSYRSLYDAVENEILSKDNRSYFSFGDEFLGNILEQHSYRMMRKLENRAVYSKVKSIIYQLVETENLYKKQRGYSLLDEKNNSNNYLVIMRRGILKKFIESDLYLKTKKIKDGALAQQVYFGIAAGFSMIFATIVAFTAQMRYGNFTMPLFFALVISYIFKDRIKDLMGRYFNIRLTKRYYDNKRELEIQRNKIGWVKEAFSFVHENSLDSNILDLRKRSPLVQAENDIYNEQILLYRKLVKLSANRVIDYNGYQFVGINDITRFNLTSFVQKMDNPFVPLYMPDRDDGYVVYTSEKIYMLNIIVCCKSFDGTFYRKFRLLFNRDGIKEIIEMKE